MLNNETIAVAMSGGVDSSTVAAMLRAEGHNLVGLTAQLWNQRRLAGKPGMPEQVRASLQYLCARCNQLALYTPHRTLDHIEVTPLDRLRADRDFLAGLTAHEHRGEAELLAEVLELYERFVDAAPEVQRQFSDLRPIGSFERTWTFPSAEARPVA